MQLNVNGRTVELSENGWMENMAEWNEEVAAVIARDVEKVDMTEDHWIIIRESRAYFDEFGTVPEMRQFSKIMKGKYGAERSTQQYFYGLFPHGLIKSANKIAGLPRPKGCS